MGEEVGAGAGAMGLSRLEGGLERPVVPEPDAMFETEVACSFFGATGHPGAKINCRPEVEAAGRCLLLDEPSAVWFLVDKISRLMTLANKEQLCHSRYDSHFSIGCYVSLRAGSASWYSVGPRLAHPVAVFAATFRLCAFKVTSFTNVAGCGHQM